MSDSLRYLSEIAELWAGGPIDTCQHGEHDTVDAPLVPFPFTCFPAETYRDTEGWCAGDDDVSRTLLLYGQWEREATALVLPVLDGGGLVLDVGCHIGWYAIQAARAGHATLCVAADPEHLRVLGINAERNDVADLVVGCLGWIDADTRPVPPLPDGLRVTLAKVDIEGNDVHAITALWPLIAAGLVDHILCEVSPVFSPGYPEMVDRLLAAGYDATLIPEMTPLTSGAGIADVQQRDVFFTRRR